METNLYKLLLKMSRWCIYGIVIQLSAFTMAFAFEGNAQNKSINEIQIKLNIKAPSKLERVLETVEKSTDFHFSYRDDQLKASSYTVNLESREYSLGDLLMNVSMQTNLSFRRINENIYIVRKQEGIDRVTEAIDANITVSGRVTDEQGEALPGASVIIKGTNTGTTTDIDGNFNLNCPEDATLIFSFVGYQPKEVLVNNQSVLNISLVLDVDQLEEVVVVGYGTVRKSDLTGSVVSIKAEDINQGVNNSLDQMLLGRAAGVSVVQNSSEPGGGISISIRGASSFTAGTDPLYVIDGLPINNNSLTGGSGPNFPDSRTPNNPLSAINPNDIESIEILKDASATAIYGSRGANGVILITTKKGREGSLKVGYDGYIGIQNVIKRLDLLTPTDYQRVLNDIIADGGGVAAQEITEIQEGGTDWQDMVFRDNAPVQNHNISLAGGSDKTNIFAAVNYFGQEGVVVSSSFERYGARININSNVTDKLEVGLNLNSSYSVNDLVPAQSFGVNENNGALYAAYNFDPTLSPYNVDGTYQVSPFMSIDNPLALAYGKNSEIKSTRNLGVVFADYKILPSLSVKLNVGTDLTSQRKDNYITRATKDGSANGGIGAVFNENRSNYLIEFTSTFDKRFGDHSLTVLGGITTQKFFSNSTSMFARSFPSDATGTDNMGLGDPTLFNMETGRFEYRLLSYMGRANYSLLNKYLLTATVRVDGSSRFGENNKFGYFPSAAFAWKITEESFMAGLSSVSTLKLRTSWGQTGNQAIGNYNSISTFAAGGDAVFNVNGSSTKFATTAPTRLANPDLKWETTEQWDIGFDFGFLNDRIYGGVDYFRKNTFDMLINLPVPTSTGFTSQLRNVGSIENYGFEANINTVNLEGGELEWTSTINIATIKNEVLGLGGIEQIIEGGAGFTGGFFLTEEGQTLRSFYGYQVDGVWQTNDDFSVTTDNVAPGDLKFRDVTGDGAVNADDRILLGNSFPDFTWSFGNTLDYKNFNLMVFFEGVEGVSMLNQNLVDTYFPINFRRNKFAEPYLNRWTPENPSNEYPSFVNPGGQGTKQANSYTITDASYLRLKTITLSYTLPDIINGVSNATFYVTGTNLWTISDYIGIDPAVNPNGSALTRIDYNAYPTAKSFLLGVRLNF